MKIVLIALFAAGLLCGPLAHSQSDSVAQSQQNPVQRAADQQQLARQQAAQQQLQHDQEKMRQDQQKLGRDQQALKGNQQAIDREQDLRWMELDQHAVERDQRRINQDQQSLELNQQQREQQMQQAQREMEQAAQRMAELSLQMQGPMISRLSHMLNPNRAVLGISIDDAPSPQGASGVNVMAVTPGGPAEKAGIRVGDVITAINGVNLKTTHRESAADQLLDFMDKAKPGDRLKLSYLRNGRSYDAEVTAGRLSDYSFAMGAPAMPPASPVSPANLRAIFEPLPYFGGNWPWNGMQLVQLTPGLGQYFGTDQGLLVVHAPRDSALNLEDGDVILKIGEREPGSPSHAMRILYSYAPGETLTLHILRKDKHLTLSIVVPKTRPPVGPYQPMSLRDQAFIARWADQGLG